MQRTPTRQERLELFRYRGAHRLVLECLFHSRSARPDEVQEACRLSHRFTQAILERGLVAGVIRIERPGLYSVTNIGTSLIGSTGGLMFDIEAEVFSC